MILEMKGYSTILQKDSVIGHFIMKNRILTKNMTPSHDTNL